MRVFISRGELIQTTSREINGRMVETNIAFPLRGVDGALASFDYRGEAYVADGKLRIELGVDIYEYTIEPISKASNDQADGYFFGAAQKRKVAPKTKSVEWMDGWRQAWSEKQT